MRKQDPLQTSAKFWPTAPMWKVVDRELIFLLIGALLPTFALLLIVLQLVF
jgi:hypothetical protein